MTFTARRVIIRIRTVCTHTVYQVITTTTLTTTLVMITKNVLALVLTVAKPSLIPLRTTLVVTQYKTLTLTTLRLTLPFTSHHLRTQVVQQAAATANNLNV